jgi:hypothetical protein
MRVRRVVVILCALAGLALLSQQGWRAYIAYLMWRGHYARLEGIESGRYFIPAVRRLYSPRGKLAGSGEALGSWASRRFHSRFPTEVVTDLGWLPGNELMLLLRRDVDEEDPGESRLLILDLNNSESIVSESAPFEGNGWGFDLQSFSAWEGPAILVHTIGRGERAVLLRREGSRLPVLHKKQGSDVAILFLSYNGLELKDLDGDGVPEVCSSDGMKTRCPVCSQEADCTVMTWKLVDGFYRKWTERGEDCGIACERAWSFR